MSLSVTGDTQAGTAVAVQVCENSIPVVAAADLADKDASINITAASGKKKGSVVINDTTNELHVATGPLPTDTWVNAGAVAAVITPA